MTRRAVPRRWLSAICVIAAVVATGCSVEDNLVAPTCAGDRAVLIAAQSVPTASQVPCFDTLPAGWEFENVSITQDGTHIVLDSDRAGPGAARLHYVADCDLSGTVSTPSDDRNIKLFEDIEMLDPSFKARRFHVFDGGCGWWQFDFDPGVSAALRVELDNTLQWWGRQEFNDSFSESFIDEDL